MSFMMLDTLKFAERLQEGGFTQEQSRTQARAIADIVIDHVASKHDIVELREDITRGTFDLKSEVRQECSQLKVELKQEFQQECSQLRSELKQEIKQECSQLKVELKQEFQQECSQLRSELKQEIKQECSQLKVELKSEIQKEISELRREIYEVKSSVIQWVVGIVLSVGLLQTAVVTGLILKLVD